MLATVDAHLIGTPFLVIGLFALARPNVVAHLTARQKRWWADLTKMPSADREARLYEGRFGLVFAIVIGVVFTIVGADSLAFGFPGWQ
jgi:hypothetical protein